MDATFPQSPVWSVISSCIQDRIRTVTPLSNSSFTENFSIQCESNRYFLKLSSNQDCLEAEADGLRALSAANSIRVPNPVANGTAQSIGFLVVEYLALQNHHSDFARMGRDLANLHRSLGTPYGWHQNNFLGGSIQINSHQSNWAEFFNNNRLGYQFQLACDNGFGARLGMLQDRVLDRVTSILDSHKPEPSLLHGDLWQGNYGFIEGGVPVIFDPAVYVGDRETDIAMTRLFGGFPSSFYESYRKEWPLPSGWEQRQVLYNLYHVLNHLNLFGGSYLQQSESMCRQLLIGN